MGTRDEDRLKRSFTSKLRYIFPELSNTRAATLVHFITGNLSVLNNSATIPQARQEVVNMKDELNRCFMVNGHKQLLRRFGESFAQWTRRTFHLLFDKSS